MLKAAEARPLMERPEVWIPAAAGLLPAGGWRESLGQAPGGGRRCPVGPGLQLCDAKFSSFVTWCSRESLCFLPSFSEDPSHGVASPPTSCQSHLRRPGFQTRSHSQAPGARPGTCLLRTPRNPQHLPSSRLRDLELDRTCKVPLCRARRRLPVPGVRATAQPLAWLLPGRREGGCLPTPTPPLEAAPPPRRARARGWPAAGA